MQAPSSNQTERTLRQAAGGTIVLKAQARIIGALYLLVIIGALFIPFAVSPSGISGMTLDQASLTAVEQVRQSRSTFVLSAGAQLLILVFDVAIAILLYDLLKPVSRSIALAAATFRLIFVAVAGANLFNHFAASILLSRANYLTALSGDQLQSLGIAVLKLRAVGYDVALVFFGIHCALLGYLFYKSGLIPRSLALLLGIGGGVGYLANILVHAMPVQVRGALFPYLMVPAGIAEVALALWMIIFGINTVKWEALSRGPE